MVRGGDFFCGKGEERYMWYGIVGKSDCSCGRKG